MSSFLRLDNLGDAGLAEDLPGWQYPPNALTAADNVRCADGILDVYTGASIQAATLPGVAAAAFAFREQEREQIIFILEDGSFHSLMAGVLTAIPSNAGTITPPTADQWTCAILAGVPYFTHINQPMVYLDQPGETGQTLEIAPYSDALNWAGRGVTAALIRPYKQHLVAANGVVPRTTGGAEVYDPQRVSWSAAVLDTKTAPLWSTDPIQDNGTRILADMKSAIIEAQPLRDALILYGTEEAQAMTYIRGQEIMRFDRLPAIYGALGRNCVAEIAGQHLVVGQDDIYIHDGQTPRSVASKREQRSFYSRIVTSQAWRIKVEAYIPAKEVWIFYPGTSGVNGLTHALIWNWEDDTFYHRDLTDDPLTRGITAVAIAKPRGALGEGVPPDPPPGSDDDTFDGGADLAFEDENLRIFDQDYSSG